MDKKDVIRIAREVSLNFANRSDECTLIEFAEAIASAEREECAKVCGELAALAAPYTCLDGWLAGANWCADAIRERSNAQAQARPEAPKAL